MEERFITYGLSGNKSLLHISEVENGIKCRCVCAHCKAQLIAKNNPENIKVAHFAHLSGSECVKAYESTLHLLAKSVFERSKELFLPAYHWDNNVLNYKSLVKEGQLISFDTVILEETVHNDEHTVRPDAIGFRKERRLFVEFANTHFVEESKRSKLIELGVPCVEIDLANVPMDEVAILELLKSKNHPAKYWVCNPYLKSKHIQKVQRTAKEKEQREKESQQKLQDYRASGMYRIIQVKDDEVNCPLSKAVLKDLKTSRLYNHQVLKKIIDGTYWNGEIYGHQPNGCWIFLKNEKHVIYPSANKAQDQTPQEQNASKIFYAGLKEIQHLQKNPDFGKCANCEFSVERIGADLGCFQICKHPRF